VFHDELGNLWLQVTSNESDTIEVGGIQEPLLGGWMRSDEIPLTLTGPVFSSGGLYEYKVEVLTVDSDDNLLDQRIELEGAVSLAETSFFKVTDSQLNLQEIQIISYFDSPENVNFESNQMSFSMPFDWNQNFEQLSVVHEEIRISANFSEFLHTKYDAKVNGIPLKDEAITIDDYSSDGRTIHIVINREELNQIKEQAIKHSDLEMFFELGPNEEVVLPLEAITPDLRYQVYLSWEPKIINADEEITFFLKTDELFTNKSNKEIEYQFKISQEGNEIYKEYVIGSVNSETPDKIPFKFSPEHIGTIKLDVLDIQGYPLSNVNFLVVVEPQNIPKFPINLKSISKLNPGEGSYDVDLTWVPPVLIPKEASEFIFTIYERDTKIPVSDVYYEFVLIQKNEEIFRKAGTAPAGGYFEDFIFSEASAGQVLVKLDRINKSDEYVEISVNVVPEFGLFSLLVLGIGFAMVMIIGRNGKLYPRNSSSFLV